MASATLTAINAQPTVSRSPARRLSRRQGDAGRQQQAIAEKGEASGEGQGLRPEPERVGQSLRALGRQRRQPELRRQTGVEERADKQGRRAGSQQRAGDDIARCARASRRLRCNRRHDASPVA